MFNRFASGPGTMNTPASSASSSVGNSFFNPTPSPFASTPASSSTVVMPTTPYSVTSDLENSVSIKLLSISAMPAYRHLSHEEIRVDDYARNRKGPSTFPGTNPAAFSQPFSTPQSNPFGTQPTTNANPFGGQPQSLFGNNTTTSSSLFGSQQQQQLQPSGFGFNNASTGNIGAFGGGSTIGSSGGFGSSTGSGFGVAPSSTFAAPIQNAFGSSTPAASAFGSNTTASTGGFGASTMFGALKPTTGTGLFGSATPSTPTTSAFGSFPSSTGIFGQTAQPQQQPLNSSFGTAFGPQPSVSTQQQSQPQGFGTGFGSTTNAPTSGSLFGSSTSTNTNPSAGGLFGSAPSTGGGLFGSTAPATTTQSTGLFGQPQQAQTPATSASGFSGFGTSATSGTTGFGASSLFGQTQPQQQQPSQQSQGLQFQQPQQQQQPFSFNRPTTSNFGSLLNSAPSATTPLATSTSSSQQPSTSGQFSLFNKPPTSSTSTTSSGLFGGFGGSTTSATTSSLQPTTGSSLFGPSTSLTSSTFPQTSSTSMFSSQPSYNSTSQSQLLQQQHQQQQQMNLPILSSSLSLAPALPSIYTTTKPSSESNSASSAPVTVSHKFTPRTSFRIKPRESYTLSAPIPLNYGVSGSTAVSSGGLVPRKIVNANTGSLKKLIIGDDFEDRSNFGQYDTLQCQTATTINNTATTTQAVTSAAPTTLVQEEESILTSSMSFGQVYMFPPASALKALSPAERSHVKNFIVGQKGIGQIRFLCPVDLNGIEIDHINGRIVQFYEGEAVLYSHPSDVKPAPGQGLNVPAQVRLDRIWTFSRGSHEPIVDPKSEKVLLFIEKLKETEGTHFINYDPANGAWTFTVDHF